jgi:sorbitol-specific phosphotransferase system component IIC
MNLLILLLIIAQIIANFVVAHRLEKLENQLREK